MTSPTASSGTDSVTSMIGSSRTGAGGRHRLAHRDRARHAERLLGGVHRVVAAVEEPHAHALDREAGDRAVGHRVDDALLHRRDEPVRDHAALDRVDELEGPVAQRLDLDVAVAELTAPAGLLLVAAVRLGAARGSSPGTGTRGGLRSTSAPKRAFSRSTTTSTCICDSPATICSPVCWSRCRSIVGSSSCRRRSAGEDLVLVALGLGLHRERHDRRGQRDRRHRDRLVALGEPVARAGLLELGDGADVAGAERRRRARSPCPANGRSWPMRSLWCVRVFSTVRVVVHDALVDAEEVHAPRERVGAAS